MGECRYYGLVVEGAYDKPVFEELVRKILSARRVRENEADVKIEARPCGGRERLMSRFPGFLRSFEFLLQGNPVDKALVIRDSDGRDSDEVERKMADKVRGQRFAFPREVQFCAVQRNMETWLLADVNAINCVARERGGHVVGEVPDPLEEIFDPKGELGRLLARAGLPYDPEVCREIVERSDLERLRCRCPSFRSFERKVTDC